MRIKHTIQVEIARDEAMRRKLFSDDSVLAQVIIDTYQRQASSSIAVAASATESLPLGDVDAVKRLYLDVDADCLLYVNGSATPIQLRAGNGVAKLFIEADIASLSLENQSVDTELTGMYCVWGDPTP